MKFKEKKTFLRGVDFLVQKISKILYGISCHRSAAILCGYEAGRAGHGSLRLGAACLEPAALHPYSYHP